MTSPRRTTAMIGAAAACAPLALVEAPPAMQVAAGLIGALCMVAGHHLDQRRPAEHETRIQQVCADMGREADEMHQRIRDRERDLTRLAHDLYAAPDPGPPPDGDHDVIMAWNSDRPVRYIRHT